MRRFLIFPLIAVLIGLTGCVTPPEKKPVGPESSSSYMPWNRSRPGEGNAQFGGMLQKR
jgi:hypothetical protein